MGTKDGYYDNSSVGDQEEGITKNGAFDGLGAFTAHPHRPFPGVVGAGGPTSRRRYTVGDIYEEASGDGGVCFGNALYHQPFRTRTSYNNYTAAFKFPISGGGGGGGEGMAASIGFPFTNAQRKELERQAMIYKYMVASVPVPPHLLIPPNFINFGSNGLGSRLRSGGSNLEPGRCKRTDGKKWRCSRDAAPDQKYCERHLHRGRPRSRKHVELLPNDNFDVINLNHNAENYKKTRLVTVTALSASGFPSNRADSSWQLAGANSQPYCQNHASVIKSEKKTTCDSDSPVILPYNEPKELDWLVNGGPFHVTTNDKNQQLRDRAAESSSINYQEDPSHLNLLGLFGSVESDRYNQNSFLSEAPRPFIDVWSSSRNATESPSRDGVHVMENDTSCIPFSLSINRSHDLVSRSWIAPTTQGGPLAEVLNLTSATTNITGHSPTAAATAARQ